MGAGLGPTGRIPAAGESGGVKGGGGGICAAGFFEGWGVRGERIEPSPNWVGSQCIKT